MNQKRKEKINSLAYSNFNCDSLLWNFSIKKLQNRLEKLKKKLSRGRFKLLFKHMFRTASKLWICFNENPVTVGRSD